MQTKWLHMAITFTKADIKLVSFPHIDAMVITTHIDKWDVTRVLVENGSQAEILFLSTFEKTIERSIEAVVWFWWKKNDPIGSILLPVSFGSLHNAHTEYITFDVVDMNHPYNAIFGRGLLNTFEATLHSIYLCIKVSATLGVILVYGS
jgi:hypothetical protein